MSHNHTSLLRLRECVICTPEPSPDTLYQLVGHPEVPAQTFASLANLRTSLIERPDQLGIATVHYIHAMDRWTYMSGDPEHANDPVLQFVRVTG